MKIIVYINSLGGGKAKYNKYLPHVLDNKILPIAGSRYTHTHTQNSKCNSVKVYMVWNPYRTRHKDYFSVFCLSMKE